MQNIQNDDDPDQSARNQAALAAQARAQQVADSIATAHAAGVYERARQSAVGYVPAPPGYVPPPPGHVLPPLQRGQAIPGAPVPPPPPPAFAVGAMNALADVSTAMTAIVESLTRRSGNNSRTRDGDTPQTRRRLFLSFCYHSSSPFAVGDNWRRPHPPER